MNFSPKVKEWVKADYFELKKRGDVDLTDVEVLLRSPQVKKLWTLLGPKQLVSDYRRVSPNRLFHLVMAIAVARQGIPAGERIPRTTRLTTSRKVRKAAGELKLAWTEMRALLGGQLPGPFVDSIHKTSVDVAADVESDLIQHNPGHTLPPSLVLAMAVVHAYTHVEPLLDALIRGAIAWPDQAMLVPKPGAEDADRLYFFRKLASELRLRFGAPSMRKEAIEVMVALYNSGPTYPSSISEFPPKSRPRGQGRGAEK